LVSVGGAFYEITVAGSGRGDECSSNGGFCVYSAKFLVVPLAATEAEEGAAAALSVTALGATSGVTLLEPSMAADPSAAVVVQGGVLCLRLSKATARREIVVDVRRAGRPCNDARVELVRGAGPAG